MGSFEDFKERMDNLFDDLRERASFALDTTREMVKEEHTATQRWLYSVLGVEGLRAMGVGEVLEHLAEFTMVRVVLCQTAKRTGGPVDEYNYQHAFDQLEAFSPLRHGDMVQDGAASFMAAMVGDPDHLEWIPEWPFSRDEIETYRKSVMKLKYATDGKVWIEE